MLARGRSIATAYAQLRLNGYPRLNICHAFSLRRRRHGAPVQLVADDDGFFDAFAGVLSRRRRRIIGAEGRPDIHREPVLAGLFQSAATLSPASRALRSKYLSASSVKSSVRT